MLLGASVAELCSLSNKNDIFDLNFQGSHCTTVLGDRNDDRQVCPGVLRYCLCWKTVCKITSLQMNSVSVNTVGLIKSHVLAISSFQVAMVSEDVSQDETSIGYFMSFHSKRETAGLRQ